MLEAVKRQSGGEESEKENFDRLLVLKRVKTPGSSERVKVLPISLLFRENRNKVLREELTKNKEKRITQNDGDTGCGVNEKRFLFCLICSGIANSLKTKRKINHQANGYWVLLFYVYTFAYPSITKFSQSVFGI